MKLTEKELNYILSESLQSFLNENTPNINTSVKLNRKGGVKNGSIPDEEKLKWGQGRGKQLYDKAENFKKGTWNFVKNNYGKAASIIGGLAMGALGYGAEHPIGSVMGYGAGLALSFIGPLAATIGKSYLKNRKLKNKKIPNDIKHAFELAQEAVPEYQKAANLCKRIQQNWNNACLAYNEIAKEQHWVPQTIDWKSQEIQSQIKQDFVLSSGALSGTKGRTRIDQNFNNLNISEAKQGNVDFQNIDLGKDQIVGFLSQYDNANAIKAMGQIAQLYVESYKIYFEWKSYLNAIGKNFNISWDEMKSGKLTGNKMKKISNSVNTDKLSNMGEIVNLVVVNNNYTYNRQTIILLQDTKTHKYYGIRKGIVGGEKVYNYINNGGKTFNLELFPNLLEPTKNNYTILVNNQDPVYILNTNGVKELEFQQQGNQQPTQPTQPTQQQTQQQTTNNPYGNNPYGNNWSSSSSTW